MESRSAVRNDNIRPTYEARLDGNHFMSSFLGGDHATKFGMRYRRTPFDSINITGGGATARPQSGRYRCPTPGVFGTGCPEASITREGFESIDMWEYSGYFNDSYKRDRATVNWGVRLDHQRDRAKPAQIPASPILPDLLPAIDFKGADAHVAYNDLSPRVGLTYDLRGNGKTIAKTTAARYFGLGISTADNLSPTRQTSLRYRWDDLNDNQIVERNELELGRLISFTSNYDPTNPNAVVSPAIIDPDLRNDITDEFIAGVDHELMPGFGVGVSYIWRRYHQFQDDYRLTSQLRSTDYIQRTLTAACGNASCDQPSHTVTYWELPFQRPAPTILRNDKERRSYQGLEVTARKRYSRRWMMSGSLTLNDTRYFYDGGPDVDFQDPTNIAAQQGRQVGSLNARWVAKLSGLYALPWGMSAAGFLNMRQGFPFDRVVNVNTRTGGIGAIEVYPKPRTSERYPNFTEVDARVDKTFPFARRRLVAMVDAFNLLNANTVLSRVTRQNASNANNVRTILAPRVVRFGVKVAS